MRSRKRSDINQKEIVAQLRNIGATVQLLSNVGAGVPDLLVGYEGINYLIEIKNTNTSYGKSGLNDIQTEWHNNWKGQVIIVSTVDEALTIFQTEDSNK